MYALGKITLFLLLGFSGSLASAAEAVFRLGGIVVEPDPPYRWYDYCKGRPSGSNYYLLTKILNDLGVAFETAEPISFSSPELPLLRQKLKNNELDGLVAGVPVPTEGVKYSKDPIVKVTVGIFYNESRVVVESLADLQDKTAIIMSLDPKLGSYNQYVAWAEKHGLNYRVVKATGQAINLIHGADDVYFLANRYDVELNKAFKRFDMPRAMYQLHFVMSERSPWIKLLPEINAALALANQQGTIEKVQSELARLWLNNDVRSCATPRRDTSYGNGEGAVSPLMH